MINASIITIGDELLIGQVIDTNSAFIAQQLNTIGVPVVRRLAVGDDWDEIWSALNEESNKATIIIITGGLGPTSDDITKPLLCKYFGGKMIVDKEALEKIKYIFEHIHCRPMIERNAKQAEVPDVCTVIQNNNGTAPGMIFYKENKIFISLPGVPHEMKAMIIDNVIPLLKNKFSLPTIIHKTLITYGVGESFLAELIKDFEASLPSNIKLAYLPNYGMVRLRLTSQGIDKEKVTTAINEQFSKLQLAVKQYLISIEDEPIEKIIANILLAKNETLGTVESCTGGYIAHLITSIAGSSKYYGGSIISYSNKIKEDLVGVKTDTILQKGAVSEQVVIEMVKGGLMKLKTNYAIAVSGIMGPDGGTVDKPVGTVWIAVGNDQKIVSKKFQLRNDRKKNIEQAAVNALIMLRNFILE